MAEGRLAPAPISNQEHYVSAPLSGADFLFAGKYKRFIKSFRYHKGFKNTPIDEVTKLPYPLLPYEGIPTELSLHHAAHPRTRKELRGIENGDITRAARMQWVSGPAGSVLLGQKLRDFHQPHQRYHYFYKGPEWLPSTEEEQFAYGVWAGSLFVPDFGLDVSGKKAKVRRMTEEQKERLHAGQIKIGAPEYLNTFLRRYVIKHGIPHVDGEMIDDFMNTEDIESRINIGRVILSQASEVVTEPIQTDFERAHRMHSISPYLGASAAQAVNINIVNGNQEKLVRQLHTAIAA
jgi:hypothetical protein